MAKWGQGDPRWIVEDRPDATNVNNWHWTTKNANNWSKDKLQELLVGLKIENDIGSCEIKDLSKTEGEASVNNRKGKLVFIYEWVLSGQWEGKLADGQKNIKGTYEIPNLSEEFEIHEIDVDIKADKDTDEARAVKDFMRSEGAKVIRQQLEKYLTLLKNEYSQGVILPSRNADCTSKSQSNNKENIVKREMNKVVESAPSSSETTNNVGVRIPTSTVTMKETFNCEASFLYSALTTQELVRAYTGGESVLEAESGGRFALMGGNVLGDFTELVPEKKVCMRWRMKSWPDEHYSSVTINLEGKEGTTELSMKQTGVPQKELDRTREGWKVNFWERMKAVFSIGSSIA